MLTKKKDSEHAQNFSWQKYSGVRPEAEGSCCKHSCSRTSPSPYQLSRSSKFSMNLWPCWNCAKVMYSSGWCATWMLPGPHTTAL